jgi:hypothetical protein
MELNPMVLNPHVIEPTELNPHGIRRYKKPQKKKSPVKGSKKRNRTPNSPAASPLRLPPTPRQRHNPPQPMEVDDAPVAGPSGRNTRRELLYGDSSRVPMPQELPDVGQLDITGRPDSSPDLDLPTPPLFEQGSQANFHISTPEIEPTAPPTQVPNLNLVSDKTKVFNHTLPFPSYNALSRMHARELEAMMKELKDGRTTKVSKAILIERIVTKQLSNLKDHFPNFEIPFDNLNPVQNTKNNIEFFNDQSLAYKESLANHPVHIEQQPINAGDPSVNWKHVNCNAFKECKFVRASPDVSNVWINILYCLFSFKDFKTFLLDAHSQHSPLTRYLAKIARQTGNIRVDPYPPVKDLNFNEILELIEPDLKTVLPNHFPQQILFNSTCESPPFFFLLVFESRTDDPSQPSSPDL